MWRVRFQRDRFQRDRFQPGVAALLAVATVLLFPANLPAKTKIAAAKRNGLEDYVQRVSAKAPDPVPTTLGSLWRDSGRLANMVADYKASRVGDLVTISISQNLSASSAGSVATNRAFSASSGITALPGSLKTASIANLFSPTSAQALTGKGNRHFPDFLEHNSDWTRGGRSAQQAPWWSKPNGKST